MVDSPSTDMREVPVLLWVRVANAAVLQEGSPVEIVAHRGDNEAHLPATVRHVGTLDDDAVPPPRRIAITCPMCRAKFSLPLNVTPRVSFGWSNTKGFLHVDVTAGGIEHECKRPGT